MRFFPSAPRAVLLTLSLLSACAAADPTASADRAPKSTGHYGNFLAGRFALNHGDYDAAAADLSRALAANPNDQELLVQTFLACVNAGRPEAIPLARRLPNNQIAQLVLGNDAAKSGDWAQATGIYRALPRDGVMQLLQPLLVAWASQGSGATDQALATLRPIMDAPRYKSLAALHAGMIADLAGRTRDAAIYYQQAAADVGEITARSALILASWQARAGDQAGAERTLAKMASGILEMGIAVPALTASLGKRPVARALDGLSEVYATFAGALRARETTDFAMILSRFALDVRPDSGFGHLLAADIQAAAKRPESALRLLDAVLDSKDPIVPVIRLRHAGALHRLERTDEAIREVERIGRDYPASALPDQELGDLLRIKRRFGEAIIAYDRVVARIRKPGPNDWSVYYSRGIAFERTGQWAKAEADFFHALELSPDQPSVMNYLGYSWADMGRNLDKAHDLIQRAANRRPNDGAITDSLGWVLYRQGKYAEAMKLLERAAGLEPEDSSITEHLGDVYWAIGRRIEAHYQWRRALTLNPTPDDAAKLESKIKSHPFGTVASGR